VKLRGRTIYRGRAAGEALVSCSAISFYGGVDPETGTVVEVGHELEGQSARGRVLVFPRGKGSTVGSYTLLRLKAAGAAPCAIVNSECETITAVGCIIAEIPCVDRVATEELETGDWVVVDGTEGTVEVIRRRGG
jgi:predicted aconitase with swiveling domain